MSSDPLVETGIPRITPATDHAADLAGLRGYLDEVLDKALGTRARLLSPENLAAPECGACPPGFLAAVTDLLSITTLAQQLLSGEPLPYTERVQADPPAPPDPEEPTPSEGGCLDVDCRCHDEEEDANCCRRCCGCEDCRNRRTRR